MAASETFREFSSPSAAHGLSMMPTDLTLSQLDDAQQFEALSYYRSQVVGILRRHMPAIHLSDFVAKRLGQET